MISISTPNSFRHVLSEKWDALVGSGSPFMEHAFLWALERTGCAIASTGWEPRPILVFNDGELVAAAATWKKTHSMGEFVYDHGWAQGVERAGLPYYPKLVVGSPFSPVTGGRLLGDPQWIPTLLQAIQTAAADCTSVHFLFPLEAEASALTDLGYFSRLQYQFHWLNEGYSTYDDFLSRFVSKDRNKLRRERKEVAHLQFQVTTDPTEADIDALYAFYSDTTSRYFYGQRYLSREFFQELRSVWQGRLHTVIAKDGATAIAGAFNVRKGKRLYGRYWGTLAEVPFLHFEVCYHRAIEYAIANGLEAFEPGHGGEHKYRRGFTPTITWSSHRFADPRLQKAFSDWTAKEAAAVRTQVAELQLTSKLR